MEQILLSIIIPVYNAEAHIRRCIDSIHQQEFSTGSFEIILINDGSKDKSLDIIKKVAETDLSIILINKNNEGPGIARNYGIKKARGQYLLFLDSDDFFETDSLKEILQKSIENKLDLHFFGSHIETPDGSMISRFQNYKNDILYNGIYIVKNGIEFSAVWNCLYSTTFIRTNHAEFIDSYTAEDVNFTMKLYPFAQRIMFSNTIVYHYTFNHLSINRGQSADKHYKLAMGKMKAMNDIDQRLASNFFPQDIKEIYKRMVNSFMIASLIEFLKKESNFTQKEIFRFLYKAKENSIYPIKGRTLSWKSSILGNILNIEVLYYFLVRLIKR